jgi:hypothetical protein
MTGPHPDPEVDEVVQKARQILSNLSEREEWIVFQRFMVPQVEFQDGDWATFYKEADQWLSHTDPLARTAIALLEQGRALEGLSGRAQPCHDLHPMASGIVLLAKHDDAWAHARAIAEQASFRATAYAYLGGASPAAIERRLGLELLERNRWSIQGFSIGEFGLSGQMRTLEGLPERLMAEGFTLVGAWPEADDRLNQALDALLRIRSRTILLNVDAVALSGKNFGAIAHDSSDEVSSLLATEFRDGLQQASSEVSTVSTPLTSARPRSLPPVPPPEKLAPRKAPPLDDPMPPHRNADERIREPENLASKKE